jgi:hypothetical protein
VRAQVARDVDHRDSRQRDRVVGGEDEVGVAVAVRIDALDVDDPPRRRLAIRNARVAGGRRRAERDGGRDDPG